MKTRVLSVSLAAALSVSLLAVQPASALTVFDPSNFVQNTLTAVRTLEQINNQINQLQNEAQMLMNQARNLTKLDFNIVNRLRSTLATTERLIAEAQGLAYDMQSMDATFSRLYPEQYAATMSGDRMATDAANVGRTRSMACTPRCRCRRRCRRTWAKTKACWPTSWARASRPKARYKRCRP